LVKGCWSGLRLLYPCYYYQRTNNQGTTGTRRGFSGCCQPRIWICHRKSWGKCWNSD